MEQRALRREIFCILFEYDLMKSNVEQRIEEFLENNRLSKAKKEFFEEYIRGCVENEEEIVFKIKEKLHGWTYERLGAVEKTILKMSFYEIIIKDSGHEIVINEAMELAKTYGDLKTREFLNGILADLVKEIM